MFILKLLLMDLVLISAFIWRRKLLANIESAAQFKRGHLIEGRRSFGDTLFRATRDNIMNKARKRGGAVGKIANIADSLRYAWVDERAVWVRNQNEPNDGRSNSANTPSRRVTDITRNKDTKSNNEAGNKVSQTSKSLNSNMRNVDAVDIKNDSSSEKHDPVVNQGIDSSSETKRISQNEGTRNISVAVKKTYEAFKNQLARQWTSEASQTEGYQGSVKTKSLENKEKSGHNKTLLRETNNVRDILHNPKPKVVENSKPRETVDTKRQVHNVSHIKRNPDNKPQIQMRGVVQPAKVEEPIKSTTEDSQMSPKRYKPKNQIQTSEEIKGQTRGLNSKDKVRTRKNARPVIPRQVTPKEIDNNQPKGGDDGISVKS